MYSDYIRKECQTSIKTQIARRRDGVCVGSVELCTNGPQGGGAGYGGFLEFTLSNIASTLIGVAVDGGPPQAAASLRIRFLGDAEIDAARGSIKFLSKELGAHWRRSGALGDCLRSRARACKLVAAADGCHGMYSDQIEDENEKDILREAEARDRGQTTFEGLFSGQRRWDGYCNGVVEFRTNGPQRDAGYSGFLEVKFTNDASTWIEVSVDGTTYQFVNSITITFRGDEEMEAALECFEFLEQAEGHPNVAKVA